MAAMLSAKKRALFNISTSISHQYSPIYYSQSPSRLSRACSSSSAFDRAEKPDSKIEVKEFEDDPSGLSYRSKELLKETSTPEFNDNAQTQDMTSKMSDVACDMANFKEDGAREGMNKMNETAASMGETRDQTVPGTWGMAKETVEKIKDTVIGEDEDEEEVKGPNRGEEIDDSSIGDLRRRAGGYDKKND